MGNINSKLIYRNLLSSTGYLNVSKIVARTFGLFEALLLADLISKDSFFENNNPNYDNWFFNTEKNREEDTTLSPKRQRNAIKTLINMEILKTKKQGIPAKIYFKINYKNLNNKLGQNGTTSQAKTALIINNNKINNNKIVLLKKTKSTKVTFAKTQKSPRNKFIEFWNKLNVRKHNNPKTKIYQKANKLITQLRAGTFQTKKYFNEDFLTKNKIPQNLLNRKWKEKEIERGLKRLSKLFINGYWPENKSKLPKDLPTLLYNPKTQTSWFLLVMVNRPHLLDSAPNIDPAIIAVLNKYCFLDQDIPKQVLYNIPTIERWYADIDWDFKGYPHKEYIHSFRNNLKRDFPNVPKLIEHYCEFLIEERGFTFFPNEIFNADSSLFRQFIQEYEKEIFTFKIMFKEET